jgi:hypothetical protein
MSPLPGDAYTRWVRLLKLDPVFDQSRGWRRLRLWTQMRVRRPIRSRLIRWNILEPDFRGVGINVIGRNRLVCHRCGELIGRKKFVVLPVPADGSRLPEVAHKRCAGRVSQSID